MYRTPGALHKVAQIVAPAWILTHLPVPDTTCISVAARRRRMAAQLLKRLATLVIEHSAPCRYQSSVWSCPRVAPRDRFCSSLHDGQTSEPVLYGGQKLEDIRHRIFGTHIGNGLMSGRKLLRRKLIGEKVAAYYPQRPERMDTLFQSVDEERRAPCYPPITNNR